MGEKTLGSSTCTSSKSQFKIENCSHKNKPICLNFCWFLHWKPSLFILHIDNSFLSSTVWNFYFVDNYFCYYYSFSGNNLIEIDDYQIHFLVYIVHWRYSYRAKKVLRQSNLNRDTEQKISSEVKSQWDYHGNREIRVSLDDFRHMTFDEWLT